MDNYLQITFDTKPKKLKEAILLVINESAGEYVETVDLFETKQNKTGFTVELPQAYDDEGSDAIAEQIAHKLFDEGYNNFDIEVFSTILNEAGQKHEFLDTIVNKYNKPNMTRADVQSAEREAKATEPSGDGLIGGFKRFAINESYRVKYVLGHLAKLQRLPGLYNSRGNFCYIDEQGEAASAAGGSLDQLLALARRGLSPASKVNGLADRFRRYENATSGQGQATWNKVQEIIRLHGQSMAGPAPSAPAEPAPTPAQPTGEQPTNTPYNADQPFKNLEEFLSHNKGGLANDPEYTEAIKELQAYLKNANMYEGDIDGKYGPQTRAAVRKFQEENGLDVDGDAGPSTIGKMMDAGDETPSADNDRMSDDEALQAFIQKLQDNDYAAALAIADEYPSVRERMQPGHYELLQQEVERAGGEVDEPEDTSTTTDAAPDDAPTPEDIANRVGQGFTFDNKRYTIEMAKVVGSQIIFIGKERLVGQDPDFNVYAVSIEQPQSFDIADNEHGLYRSRATRQYDRIDNEVTGSPQTLRQSDILYQFREVLLGQTPSIQEPVDTPDTSGPDTSDTGPNAQTTITQPETPDTSDNIDDIDTSQQDDSLETQLATALADVEDDAPFEFQGTPVTTQDNAAGIDDEYEDTIMRLAQSQGVDTEDRDPVEVAAEVIDGVENADRVNQMGITAPATAGNGIPADFNMQWQSVSEMILNEDPHTEVLRAFNVAIEMLNKNVLTPALRSLVMQEVADNRRYAEFQDDALAEIMAIEDLPENSKRNFRLIVDFKAALRGDVDASQRIGLQLPIGETPEVTSTVQGGRGDGNAEVAQRRQDQDFDDEETVMSQPVIQPNDDEPEYTPSSTVQNAVNSMRQNMQRRKRNATILRDINALETVEDFEYMISEMGETFLDDLIEQFDQSRGTVNRLKTAIEPLGYTIEDTGEFFDPYKIVKADTDENT